MKRFKATVEYDGTNYFGWQKQNDNYSVQEAIEKAMFKFKGEHIAVHASGRTDAGVHATGQVIHFDMDTDYSAEKIMAATNAHLLKEAVIITAVEMVDENFNARFSAVSRSYCYKIINRRARAVIDKNRVWVVYKDLDIEKMIEAAAYLVGKHDFTSFRDSECQSKNPVKTVTSIELKKCGELITMDITAKSFLHHMVRNIIGSLVQVGLGKWEPFYIKEILAKKDRKSAGPTAPACGLYLTNVSY